MHRRLVKRNHDDRTLRIPGIPWVLSEEAQCRARLRSLEHTAKTVSAVRDCQEQPLPVNGENSRANVQNVLGVHHELRSPRSMKMDLVVMSRSSLNLLWNRTHFLSR